jgi:hypothetical protein
MDLHPGGWGELPQKRKKISRKGRIDGHEVAGFRGEKAKARGMEQMAPQVKTASAQGERGRTAVKLIP